MEYFFLAEMDFLWRTTFIQLKHKVRYIIARKKSECLFVFEKSQPIQTNGMNDQKIEIQKRTETEKCLHVN